MTREEAIKIFNTLLLFGRYDCPKEEIEECFNMAIKALEQEPCEDWRDVPSDEMNLEQAKQAVRDLRKFIVDNHISPKLQYCEDAISRQAVEKITWEEPSYTDALNALTEVREKVRALPPVIPQPKK